jgi:type IV secretory pathway TrbD component
MRLLLRDSVASLAIWVVALNTVLWAAKRRQPMTRRTLHLRRRMSAIIATCAVLSGQL